MPLEVPLRDALEGRRIEAWSHDGALTAAQAPRSPRAHTLDACGAIAMRDRGRFERALERIAAVAPSGQRVMGARRAPWEARAARRDPAAD